MADQEKCPECGRLLVFTMAEFWKNPSYSCPSNVSRVECNDTNWLELSCAEAAKERLKTELEAARKVISESERLRRAIAVHDHAYSCIPAFDDALAEWGRLRDS